MHICDFTGTGRFIDNSEKSQRGFSLTTVLATVGALGVIAAMILPSMIQHEPLPTPESPRILTDVSQRNAAAAELKSFADNLEKYYNVDHKEDSAHFQWRLTEVTSVVGTASPGIMTRVGYIQGTASPYPADGMMAPTGQRFLFAYEGHHWVLTGLKIRLTYMGALNDGDWRDVPCTAEELERNATQKLGMRQQAL